MGRKVYGIDFGTKQIRIYKKDKGILVSEKNIIAIENKRKILAIGDEAYEMYEKAPDNVEVVFPVKNGVIAYMDYMEGLFSSFMSKINNGKKLATSDYVIAVPTDITDVQKRAFTELILSSIAKVRSIRVVEKPIAAALGAKLDITNAHGVLIVDIGADTTEISVLSLGGIVITKLLPIGGNTLDDAICSTVRKEYNLYIGNKTAEMLKIHLGCAYPNEDKHYEIYGRDMVSGLPVCKSISSELINYAIKEYLDNIIDAIRLILERTPPEISSDIIDSGIYITGGGANIRQLDTLISNSTELDVNICPDPLNTVVNGLGRIIEDSTFLMLSAQTRKHPR